MYMTLDEFKAIEEALYLLPWGEEFLALPKKEQDIIVEALASMVNIWKKHKNVNKRTWELIRAKREENPNYARPRKEWRKK